MPESLGSRLKHAWNAFTGRDDIIGDYQNTGPSYSYRPDRPRLKYGNERSIIASVYNRIAIDVASIDIQHSRLDEQGRYVETIDSGLNYCLNVEANLDQTSRAFKQDLVLSMFDEGAVAIVPVDTTLNPNVTGSYNITNMRVGKITAWYPEHVKVELWNEKEGRKDEIRLPKKIVCIIENPLYSVMNEPNSTLQRLIRKLNLLDVIDEQSGAGKLDMIINLPYVIRTDARKKQAEDRRKDLEKQLSSSKYGIAYTDGTEHVTQLNRPVENKLMSQIEYLTSMLYSQLGLTQTIFDGTADEATMLNYHNRTIEPIVAAIVDEINRKFLTKTARTQRQKVMFFNNPFKLCTVSSIATVIDPLMRNEILSPNEARQIIGFKPSDDASSDELRNRNMPVDEMDQNGSSMAEPVEEQTPMGNPMETPVSELQ